MPAVSEEDRIVYVHVPMTRQTLERSRAVTLHANAGLQQPMKMEEIMGFWIEIQLYKVEASIRERQANGE